MLITNRLGTMSSLNILCGESLNCTTITDTCLGRALPVVKKNGTPSQRLLSINSFAAINVSVVDAGATCSSSLYPGLGLPLIVPATYCPRTTLLNTSFREMCLTLFSTLVLASRMISALYAEGQSMAIMHSSCNK